MASRVRFEELAVAGVKQLFPEAAIQAGAVQAIALALSSDPTKNALSCTGIPDVDFWVRGFFSGFEIRVLFEVSDEITVWSVTRTAGPTGS